MSDTILVAYATRYGSTAGVAESIARTLREHGLDVDFRPVQGVSTLANYRAVVLGAPLYIGQLPKEFAHFLTAYETELAQRPVALFALGPVHDDPKELQGSVEQLDKELAKFARLQPITVKVFAGVYDPGKLRFPDNLIAKMPISPLHGAPAFDGRNWPAIRAWADDLASRLSPVAADRLQPA
jgi:menaquinone-dependent protoporphyrinogen oxidase